MIFLCSDFRSSIYSSQVIAKILSIDSKIPVVNAIDDIDAYNVQAGAYLLSAYVDYLPVSSIVLCIVDPGVGGARTPVYFRSKTKWFVGPDNGIFSRIIAADPNHSDCLSEIVDVDPNASLTFHGRDIFAPFAAQIFLDPSKILRKTLSSSTTKKLSQEWPDDLYEIIYIDGYGNCFTGIRGACVHTQKTITLGVHQFRHAATFCEVSEGTGFWYVNSIGLLELAVNQGSAAEKFRITVGDQLQIH